MPAYQASTLSEAVEQYFSHLNPIAQRIARDIRETKTKYGELWYTLNPHEQNDVINETLIKPEISLKYFNNFVSSSSLSSTSQLSAASYSDLILCRLTKEIGRSASVDSLTAVPPINTIAELTMPHASQKSCVRSAFKTKTKALQNLYAFDGRNLKTYTQQKVAQKIIQDDSATGYRDEHSKPFSYRTKSQINLHRFDNTRTGNSFAPNDAEDDGEDICLLSSSHNYEDSFFVEIHDRTKLKNQNAKYKKLQYELNINLGNNFEKNKDASNIRISQYNRLEKANETDNLLQTVKSSATNVTKALDNQNQNITTNIKSDAVLKVFIDTAAATAATLASSTSPITYAVYTDGYFEYEESANLMQNSDNSGILNGSSSCTTTSDDDRDYEDYDEKTLCEDVKLLDNEMNLRKGFDFLNNW